MKDLERKIQLFVEERDWDRFHSPKNLAMALSVEVAELMEHFQWISTEASRRIGNDSGKLRAITEELADVLCYAIAMANELDIDIATAVRDKVQKNEQKYPADEYRGRYG